MATIYWRGDAPAIAQVSSATITAYDASTTYRVTINSKIVSVVGTGGTVATTAAALLAALQASTIPEFREVTWTNPSGAIITGTAATAGKPFTAASSVSGGTGTFGSFSTTTTSSGPNDWSVAGNWSGGSVPTGSDDVYLQDSAVPVYYGLDQNAVTLTTLNLAASYTGAIGLPPFNTGGYYEYRDTYLKISATTLNIGQGLGSGSGSLRINLGTNASTVSVALTGQQTTQSTPALLIRGSHASNVLNATQGSIGLAAEPGGTAQFPVVRSADATLVCGTGCTLGAITQTGGDVTVNSNVTTWTKTGGTSTQLAGTLTTITQDSAGTHYWQSTGTITTGTFRGPSSVLDVSRDPRGRTLTNSTFTGGGYFLDPKSTITFTNPLATDKTSVPLCVFGNGAFNLQRS